MELYSRSIITEMLAGRIATDTFDDALVSDREGYASSEDCERNKKSLEVVHRWCESVRDKASDLLRLPL